jgi:hypothetical protein
MKDGHLAWEAINQAPKDVSQRRLLVSDNSDLLSMMYQLALVHRPPVNPNIRTVIMPTHSVTSLYPPYTRIYMIASLHHLLIKGLTYPSFGTKPGEKPLE